MQYKIPTRMDIGKIRVDFESSYEESGPFGAKSIGELVIDTPCPALAEAIYNATGVRFRELPITPEKIAMGILKRKEPTKIHDKYDNGNPAGGGISCCVLDVWHTDPGKVPVREIPGYVYYRIFALLYSV